MLTNETEPAAAVDPISAADSDRAIAPDTLVGAPQDAALAAEAHAAQERLRAILAEVPGDAAAGTGGLVVAFSGGVDSTFLLASAAEVPGLRLLAVSAASPAFPARELGEARAFCAAHGIAHEVVESPELEVPGYRDNPPDRCYLCKRGLFGELWAFARTRGYAVLADGTNVDDEGDYRPGMRALDELGVRSPLREAGLRKAHIRLLSREMGLPTWDKPSFACLSSRFAYGERITEERLTMVDAAEQFLLDLGLTQVRVRVHGAQAPVARIEVLPQEFDLLACAGVREQVDARLRALGFGYVALDLRGYRSGSMNAALGVR